MYVLYYSIQWVYISFASDYPDFICIFCFKCSAKENVTVTATNLVSSVSASIHLLAVYSLNSYTFTVENDLRGTTEYVHFEIDFDSSADIPLANVDGTIKFTATGPSENFSHDLHAVIPATLPQTFDHRYLTQGYYTVTVDLWNPVSTVTLTENVRIWDDLNPVQLVCKSNCPILITNTTAEVEFANASRSGFKYTIDMDVENGTFSSSGPDIYYHLYNLTSFSSEYTSPGIYRVAWNIENLEYTGVDGQLVLTVQNVITDFQVLIGFFIDRIIPMSPIYIFGAVNQLLSSKGYKLYS